MKKTKPILKHLVVEYRKFTDTQLEEELKKQKAILTNLSSKRKETYEYLRTPIEDKIYLLENEIKKRSDTIVSINI